MPALEFPTKHLDFFKTFKKSCGSNIFEITSCELPKPTFSETATTTLKHCHCAAVNIRPKPKWWKTEFFNWLAEVAEISSNAELQFVGNWMLKNNQKILLPVQLSACTGIPFCEGIASIGFLHRYGASRYPRKGRPDVENQPRRVLPKICHSFFAQPHLLPNGCLHDLRR